MGCTEPGTKVKDPPNIHLMNAGNQVLVNLQKAPPLNEGNKENMNFPLANKNHINNNQGYFQAPFGEKNAMNNFHRNPLEIMGNPQGLIKMPINLFQPAPPLKKTIPIINKQQYMYYKNIILDFYVIVPVFNDHKCAFKPRAIENFRIQMSNQNIKIILVECVYNNNSFSFTKQDNPFDIQIRSNSFLKNNENLINIAIN